jgi:hypothetical protein
MSSHALSTLSTISGMSTGSSSNNNNNNKKMTMTMMKLPGSGTGVDALLTEQGKQLATGQEIRFVLVKGPSRPPQPDPVNAKAPQESFPLIAKFSESVVKPNFGTLPWKTARWYQQDIPKAQDDSDDEDAAAALQQQQPKKKRWRSRNPKDVGRQWVIQEQVEFLETMMAKRKAAAAAAAAAQQQQQQQPAEVLYHNNKDTSSRYEGTTEHNPSHYILLETTAFSNYNNSNNNNNVIQVTTLPSNATVAFSQPKATHTLTMSEAEMVIQDQRGIIGGGGGTVTRFMMHDQQQNHQQSRARLLGKLLPEDAAIAIDPKTGKRKTKRQRLLDGDIGEDEDDDDDDIMADLAFRNRKGGNSKARKELLTSFGDEGMKVDSDGVLGGTNDGMFGQRGQKFGRFQADQAAAAASGGGGEDDDAGATGAGGGTTEKTSNDGLAMADDFYQRDVQAEYEELDYDANEQFDDDDVDVGETEMAMEGSGYNDGDDDEEDLEEDVGVERLTGAEGLASLAGFRLMLAKARGDVTPEQAAEMAANAKRQVEEANSREAEKKPDSNSSGDYVAEIIEKAEQARRAAEEKAGVGSAEEGGDNKNVAKKPSFTGKEVDADGQRLITLEAVRREIWLNDGRITTKRLTKIFNVKKKSSAERQAKFKDAVRELCIMETDPIHGSVLVLKQHYRRANSRWVSSAS